MLAKAEILFVCESDIGVTVIDDVNRFDLAHERTPVGSGD
jgi:hypothetical protein